MDLEESFYHALAMDFVSEAGKREESDLDERWNRPVVLINSPNGEAEKIRNLMRELGCRRTVYIESDLALELILRGKPVSEQMHTYSLEGYYPINIGWMKNSHYFSEKVKSNSPKLL
jgi:hypothetical protein